MIFFNQGMLLLGSNHFLVFKELLKDINALDVDAKTETAATSENSGRKSTENERLEVLYKHTISTCVSK